MLQFVLACTLLLTALPSFSEALMKQEYPMELELLLKSYSVVTGNNYYKCSVNAGNIRESMCGYQLQVEASSDGVQVGYVLFDKQVYSAELKFSQRDDGFRNPIRFNLTSFPNNVTVSLTMHYYSADERKIAQVFHAEFSSHDLSTIFSTDRVARQAGMSSFGFSVRIVCRPNYYDLDCGTYCRAENPLQSCSSIGELLCVTANGEFATGSPQPCSSVSKPMTTTSKETDSNVSTARAKENIEEIDSMHLTLMIGGVILIVPLVSGLCVVLVTKIAGSKRKTAQQSQTNGSGQSSSAQRPISLQTAGNSSVGAHFDNSVVYTVGGQFGANQQFAYGDVQPYRQQQQQQLLLNNELGQQQQRGCGSGSSGNCSASCGNTGYECVRLPDGAEMVDLGHAIFEGIGASHHMTAGTLPCSRSPMQFEQTDNVRSVSRYGTGRNVVAYRL